MLRISQIPTAFFITVTIFILSLSPSFAAAPATCKGVDMMREMKINDPAAFREVMAQAKSTPNANSLFWKVEIAGRPASYLFGTIHLTDTRVTTLKPAIQKALASSKRLILEIADMSEAAAGKAMAGAMHLLLFADGKNLDSLLTKDEFSIVQKAITSMGMPAAFSARLKPWFATMVMALSACERARSSSGIAALDQKLAADAKKRGIEVLGVETIKEQFASMASIPLRDQLEMLKSSIKFHNRTQDLLETMIGMYQNRQMGAAWPFQLKLAQISGADLSRFESFRQNLIVKRNLRMRDRALVHLKKGGTFFAVGALHLPDKDGLVALLRQSGFKVTPAE